MPSINPLPNLPTSEPQQPNASAEPLFEATPEGSSLPDPETDHDSQAPLLSWDNQASSQKVHRPTYWYIALGLIFAGAMIAAIWTRTWLFIPLGILVPWALAMYAGRGEDNHHYSLFTGGIQVDQKFYAYDLFKAYFPIEESQRIVFELVPTKRFSGLVTLHASGDEVSDIEEILDSVLPQTEPQGYLGESVFKRLKF